MPSGRNRLGIDEIIELRLVEPRIPGIAERSDASAMANAAGLEHGLEKWTDSPDNVRTTGKIVGDAARLKDLNP
jgi:hypothetical protein